MIGISMIRIVPLMGMPNGLGINWNVIVSVVCRDVLMFLDVDRSSNVRYLDLAWYHWGRCVILVGMDFCI